MFFLNIISTYEHNLQEYLLQLIFDNLANSSCDKLVSGDPSLAAISGGRGKGRGTQGDEPVQATAVPIQVERALY